MASNLPMNGTWTTLEINGKSADTYDPPARPRFGLLQLHDYNLITLCDNPTYTRWLAELRIACVCPNGQRSWWGDRVCEEFDSQVTPEHFLLQSVLPFFRERWSLSPRSIGLSGFGMGGQAALRLAFKRPDLFPVVAGVASSIDYYEIFNQGTPLDRLYDSKEQCRQDTALLHIHPSKFPPHILLLVDPTDTQWYRGNDRLHEKLNALGIPHEFDLKTQAGGHSWAYFNHMAERVLRFVFAGLEEESRRLL